MITTILFGVLSSLITELITVLNKELKGTLLEGRGAFVLSFGIALVGATVKVFVINGTPLPHDISSLKDLYPAFAAIWTISQVYFMAITKYFNLDTQA